MECHRTSVVTTERYVDMRTRRLQHIIANVADNADDLSRSLLADRIRTA